jgi:signal transduction histidine kinase/DNA-binding response OmpR family regulator/ligand-binding sensor domain-containing protein
MIGFSYFCTENNYLVMKQLKQVGVLVALLLFPLFGRADTGKLYTSGKLSSSLIECLCQDQYGYLWIGTEYGLNKFDGYRFSTYLFEKSDTTTIVDNEIVRVLCDKEGRLWVGCGKGLVQYDYENNRFIRYAFPDGIKPRVNTLQQISNGDILIGTAGYGLYSIRKGEDRITTETDFRKRKMDDFFSRIFEDDQHQIWRSNHLTTFTRFKVKNRKPVEMEDFESPYGAPRDYIRCHDGGFLIICLYGILRYDYATGKVTDAGYDLSALDRRLSMREATLSHNGDIYIATAGQGLMVIPHNSNVLRPVDTRSRDFNLGNANVSDVLEDKDHNIWLGCYQKGLYLLNQGQDAFRNWSFAEQNYSVGSSVSSLTLDGNGQVLCTIQNTGAYRFDQQGRIVSLLKTPVGPHTIYTDKTGHFWLCTENILYSYNPDTGTSIPKLTGSGWGLNCITDDGKGNLYICDYGKGLIAYNTLTGETTNYSMNQERGKLGTLCNDWIRSLFIDRYGMLWIGTSDGISCLNTQSRNFRQYGWEKLLGGHQCNAVNEQKQGNILIGTNAGLYIYDRIKNEVSRFPNSDTLDNKLIYGIVADREDDLWLSTSMGIWQYSQHARKWIGHINGNGLNNKEYVLGTVFQTDDGMIGFGTNDGITTFYPDVVKNSHVEMGDVFLTNLIVDGKSRSVKNDDFTVAYDENSFTMEFSLLTFRNTDNITFQYRINGKDDWISVNEGSNAISFNKMKPGKYVIEVRAVCNGIFSEKTKTITVRVKEPWYASPLAYLLYILLLMAAIAGALYLIERRSKAELEESKMRFLINATHDIRSPLTMIMGPLKKLKRRVSDPESLEDIETIDRNAQRLLLLVNQILDERKIDKNQMKLHCRETDLVPFINGILTLYNYNAQQRSISFNFIHEDEKLMAWIDRINFDKVISNLLSNAFKYTFDNGQIDVVLSHDDKHFIVKVIDNGIGLKEDNPERLFDRFYQGSNARDLHLDGTGIGLNLSKAIVNMHGGTIAAANREDGMRGTVITVQVPLGKDHLKPEEIEVEEPVSTVRQQGKQASKNFKILIADDDAEIATYIRSELGRWYRFDAAPNGKEALKALLTSDYDLLITDVMMPEMDGITLLKNIKGNTNISDIPVILLTSRAEVSDRLEGLKRGADAFISKPFNMEELHILIDNLIDNVRRLRGKFSGAQTQKEKMERVEVKGNNDVLMERIMKCINENLQDPDFNVVKLTEKVGISRAQLHRKMKEITGISAGDFIRNLRLEQAARLIRERKINVTQVAYAVGFNNQTHFSTVFKKHFGMTPTEYIERGAKSEK